MNDHLKKVSDHHDWWSETYDSFYFDVLDLYHRVTRDNILRFLPDNKDTLILDAGGGTGIWSIELAQMGYHVTLTDISEKMLEVAEKKISELGLHDNINIRICDICSMPEFENEKFDFVLCEGDPLSYCGDHHKAMKELVRVVKQGGRIIASVDNRISALAWFDKKEDPKIIEEFLAKGDVLMPIEKDEFRYVIHAFTPKELRELFESNGLTVERIIGKPVIAHRFECIKSKDPKIQERLFNLELKYNDHPDYYPRGGHLEIVGCKNK